MISTSIFAGANLFIIIAACIISAVAAIITTDIYQEVGKRKKQADKSE